MRFRHLTVFVAVLSGLAVAGCSSDDPQVSLDGARAAAAQQNPPACPLHLDPPGALKSAGVTTPVTQDSVTVEKSKTDKPAGNPVNAQQGGMSAIDAVAGVYMECDYKAATGTVDVRLVVTPVKGAANVLAPLLVHDAHLSVAETGPIFDNPPGPGEVRVIGGTVALGGLVVEGGDGAIMVTADLPDLRDDTLTTVTKALAGQARN